MSFFGLEIRLGLLQRVEVAVAATASPLRNWAGRGEQDDRDRAGTAVPAAFLRRARCVGELAALDVLLGKRTFGINRADHFHLAYGLTITAMGSSTQSRRISRAKRLLPLNHG